MSFPAGSKDADDHDPGETALWELKEETGYIGRVISVSMTHRPDPWKGVGWTKTVHIGVDLNDPWNKNPDKNLDLEPEEDIICDWIPLKNLRQ